MAKVVLVHGIAQSRKSADTLENDWVPDLAGGVRNAGHHQIADRLVHFRQPGGISVRMAFYGDLFRQPGAQGDAPGPANQDATEIEEQLAAAWIKAAAERAADSNDRRLAQQTMDQLANQVGAQGAGALKRRLVERLARISWFAPTGFALAQSFVRRDLREVSLYLTNPTIRLAAQQRVLDQIDHTTQLVIAHSLGTVVAFEALHRTNHPVALITFGSPLALRTIIYERLQPQPPTVPPTVTRWSDFADRDDLIAVHTNLRPDFPGTTANVSPTQTVNNGAKAHDASPYLTEVHLGQTVAETLQ